ncbi:MAG: isoprenylcysteine carboxylmethyltransferase family protein [Bradyrhizobium sp.]|jgi:protein-S-isoprenylcysteine O-methyltransferase Ste14|uniref:methyltransferase family protein n=1 Tax=Bradyrhizobium sp. TaxID=376 RepID=UPI0012235D67|nr:isoprenylcysteine carboxylmethyltransferase family protein [Bradyrhizobium sp.]THD52356.1 MAG: isoprenylcysteine carboxylmethyltransferase family protein [Bradyrhizobium sp.]
MSDTLFHRIEQSRFYDWTMRLPIVLYSFYALVHDVISFSAQVAQDPAMWAHADAGVIIATLARVSQWMFVALLAVLPLFRHRPIAKSTALLPRFAALVTVCIPPFCVLLDRAPPNLWCNLLATVAGVSASILGVLTLSFLGRSFSVMPEARRLVTTGPYSIVRHPLYLFELLGVVGILLQVRSLPGVMLLALIVALQIARARWEEAVLDRAIPEFAAYRQQVPFLIPRDARSSFALLREDPMARRRSAVVMSSVFGLLALVVIALPRLVG